jgi:hypothetical protein
MLKKYLLTLTRRYKPEIMKHKRKFSLLRLDSEQLRDAENKIELLSCPHGGKSCNEHLSSINGNFVESRGFRKDKDYTRSIYALKSAFAETSELKDSKCIKCADLFRTTITQSLEKIHDELQGISTGLFKTDTSKASYLLAENVLNDFKTEEVKFKSKSVQIPGRLREVV